MLSVKAEKIAKRKYYNKELKETSWEEVVRRVVRHVVEAELEWNDAPENYKFWYDVFFDLIYNLDFLPGGRILANAGTNINNLLNCFYLPTEDSLDGIYYSLSKTAKVLKQGGGVGVNLSNIRESGAWINGTGGESSGVMSFSELFNLTAETVRQASRRGAMMLILDVSHPDIQEFIHYKSSMHDKHTNIYQFMKSSLLEEEQEKLESFLINQQLTNFNISVNMGDDFINAVKQNLDWSLISPSSGKVVKTVKAKELFREISEHAWKSGDPGVVFLDRANEDNLVPYIDKIEGANPSLRKGTKVLTDKGIFSIESLEGKEFSVPTLTGEYALAKCILSGTGVRLYKIALTGGHEYYATSEHKWPVLMENGEYGKKATTSLIEGEYLRTPSLKTSLGYGSEGTYSDGFLIGWNLGDGNITVRKDNGRTQYGFVFSEDDAEAMEAVHNKLGEITGRTYKKTARNRGGKDWYEIHVSDIKIKKLFDEFGVTNKKEGLPISVWDIASEEFRKGLIDGLFSSDGSISLTDNRVVLSTSYEKLARDVSKLLGFYGLKPLINTTTASSNFKSNFPRYAVRMGHINSIKFRDIFSLTSLNKQESLESIPAPRKVSLRHDHIEVISVEQTNFFEDVWDLQVDHTTHTFELAHCVTGNCSEIFLTPNEPCCLASINLVNFIVTNELGGYDFDWHRLGEVSKIATRFLDNVIEMSYTGIEDIDAKAKGLRRIGLGTMGLADVLAYLEVPYASDEAYMITDKIGWLISNQAWDESNSLGKERGTFPMFDPTQENNWHVITKVTDRDTSTLTEKTEVTTPRNVSVTANAPTGTLSKIADVNDGIEPFYALSYVRYITDGDGARVKERLIEMNPIIFEKLIKYNVKKPDVDKIQKHILEHGDVSTCELVPQNIKDSFQTANEIGYKWHCDIQSAMQNSFSNAISKTINLPEDATVEDIEKAYMYAYDSGLKSVALYRDKSKNFQILNRK